MTAPKKLSDLALELEGVIHDVKTAAIACHTIADESKGHGDLLNFIAAGLEGVHCRLVVRWEALYQAIKAGEAP